MAKKVTLKDKDDVVLYPQTTVASVFDANGNSLEGFTVDATKNAILTTFGEWGKELASPSSWTVISKGIYLQAGRIYTFTASAENAISVGQIVYNLTLEGEDSPSNPLLALVLNNAYQERSISYTPLTSSVCKLWCRNMDGASGNTSIRIVADYLPTQTRDDVNDILVDALNDQDSKRIVLDSRALYKSNIGIVADTGAEISSSVNGCTDFILVEPGKEVETLLAYTTVTAKNGYAYYDANKNFVAAGEYRTDGSTDGLPIKVTVPSGAKYIRISIRESDLSNFYFKTSYSQYEKGRLSAVEDSVNDIASKGLDFLDIDSPISINVGAIQMTGETVWFRSSMVEVRKGMSIDYDILSRNQVPIIKLYSTNVYSDAYVIDTLRSGLQTQLYSGTYVVPQDGYIIIFNLIDSDYSVTQSASLYHFANKVLSDIVRKGVADQKTNNPITSFRINLGVNNENMKVLLSTHDADATKYDNIYIGYASLVVAERDLFYLYYEANGRYPREAETYTSQSGLLLAYSTDGEHFVREFPAGLNPHPEDSPLHDTNVLITATESEYEGYHDVIKGYPDGIDVVKVHDPVYPYRMVGNLTFRGIPNAGSTIEKIATKMYMWKSADGVNWIEIGEVSGHWYDSQYSIIPRGDLLKIYCRLRYRTSDGNTNSYVRTIGVMYTDLYGNIVTPATLLFGENLYHASASALDDKREILFPTWYGGYDTATHKDICCYKSYIVDYDNTVTETSADEIAKLQLHYDDPEIRDDNWGSVNPGLLLHDGDQYITYLQMDVPTHFDDVIPADTSPNYKDARIEIRRVPIVFNYTGIRLDELQ